MNKKENSFQTITLDITLISLSAKYSAYISKPIHGKPNCARHIELMKNDLRFMDC